MSLSCTTCGEGTREKGTYQHRPLWDKISGVDEERKNNLLQIKEAFHILSTEQKRLINKDQWRYHSWLLDVTSEKQTICA